MEHHFCFPSGTISCSVHSQPWYLGRTVEPSYLSKYYLSSLVLVLIPSSSTPSEVLSFGPSPSHLVSTHRVMFSFSKIASFAVLALGTLASASAIPAVRETVRDLIDIPVNVDPVIAPVTTITVRDGDSLASIFAGLSSALGPALCTLLSVQYSPEPMLMYSFQRAFLRPKTQRRCSPAPLWSPHSSSLLRPPCQRFPVSPSPRSSPTLTAQACSVPLTSRASSEG